MRTSHTLVVLAIALATAPLSAQPGTLDPSFGTTGYVIDTELAEAKSVAVYPDGRIVMCAGNSLYMFMPDGTRAAAFGNAGVVTPIGLNAGDVLIQPDGKILVAGVLNAVGVGQDMAAARFESDGTPDASFGVAGFVQVVLPNFDYCRSMTLLDDGRILLTGSSNIDFASHLIMMNADGSMDASFGDNGHVVWMPVPGDIFDVLDAAVQADGRIIFVGEHAPEVDDDVIGRFLPDGTLDITYNGTGTTYLDFGQNNDELDQVELDAQGRSVVLATSSDAGSFNSGSLARLNTDGTIDPTFGTNGFVALNTASTTYTPKSFCIQSDGKLVVTGTTGGTGRNLYLVRFDADGALDIGFGDAGYSIVDLPNREEGNAIAATSDQSLVVAGRSQITGAGSDLLVARFWQSSGLLVADGLGQMDPLKVVPCPAQGTFTIVGEGADASSGVLEVFDPSGRRVHVNYQFTSRGIDVQAGSLPSGFYVAYLRTKDTIRVARFEML
ncbi:MAG: hypothetical protein JNL43_04860 [Flavobacteriales bacterium]|nr:hypothetical protein [Flavobacteriales bacterium]